MNKGRWTPSQKKYLDDHLGKVPISDIAKALGKSSLAVKLYIHRQRIAPAVKVPKNVIIELLTIKFSRPEYFTPTKAFFAAIQISQLRWWSLYYGREAPTAQELTRIAHHLDLDLEQTLSLRQLALDL